VRKHNCHSTGSLKQTPNQKHQMKNTRKIKNTGIILASLALPSGLSAATISQSGTAPVSSIISQADFSAPGLNGQRDFSDNGGPPAQSFTTGVSGFELAAVTVKGFANNNSSFGTLSAATWTLSISSLSGSTLTLIDQETTGVFNPTSGSAYITITLATPVTLAANTAYAYAIHTSSGYFGFAKSATDVLVGGQAFQHGGTVRSAVTGATATNPQTGNDRTFFLHQVPEPSTLGLLGVGVLCLAARRRRA